MGVKSMLDGVLLYKAAEGRRIKTYQLRVSKSFKRQMLLMSVMVVNVLSDLGVKSISAEAQLLSIACCNH
jgi:hypothetical protein